MMGEVKVLREHLHPLVSVINPSLDGERRGNVERLLEELAQQTVQEYEILMPVGFQPNGRARNEGVRKAKGHYLFALTTMCGWVMDESLKICSSHCWKWKPVDMTGRSLARGASA